VEALKLAQQATLETRDAKHEPRSEAQQRSAWRAEAAQALGSPRRVHRLVHAVLAAPTPAAQSLGSDSGFEQGLDGFVALTRATIEASRSTWQVWHVRSEAERQVRAKVPVAVLAGGQLDSLVDQIVARVLHPSQSVRLTRPDPVHATLGSPDQLRRRDGSSVYDVAGSQTYTSPTVLADERFLVDAAHRRDGRTVEGRDVDLALLESVANGLNLNTAQAHLVRQMATSGARVQMAIAPAGSGKTTAMSALAAAWTHSGGTVLGLAPSAIAAGVLRHEIGSHADTLAMLVTTIRTGYLPAWARAVDHQTLIVVDEAGMAATGDLAAVTRFAFERGASVRLVGDDRQLAAIAAGGVLRDIQASVGAVTLTELVRFRDQAEAAAGLAIRAGDTTGLAFYIDNNRVHVGDLTTVTNQAYTAWTTDRGNGLDSIMLAPTRELATELNVRARNDRLTALEDEQGRTASGPRPDRRHETRGTREALLADGSAASAGDTIITRRNNRDLRTTVTDWVKNGDRWTVTTAHTTGALKGALEVVHLHTGRHLRLPAEYVDQHVQLGYATTVHGAQGVTADTSHTVTAGAESRQQLYVALTRGREANHLYLNAAVDGDEHSIITPAATNPQTALNLLEQILAADEAEASATTTAGRTDNPHTALTQATARYLDSLQTAATDLLGTEQMTALETHADQLAPGILDSPAWPTLRGHLALLAAEGHDPAVAFTTALREREIDTAAHVAAVLDWRLDPTHTRTATDPDNPPPAPWLPGIPAPLRGDAVWGDYLTSRQRLVDRATVHVRRQAADLTAATRPGWARQLLDPQHRELLADLLVFRAAHGVAQEDTRPTGPRQQAAADRRAQLELNQRVNAAIDTNYRTAWTPIAEQVGLTPGADPHWPVLAENLAALAHAGADAPTLLRRAAAEAQLPDEYQAAALWWRIARHVSPAVLTPEPTDGPPDPLRPVWQANLAAALDPARPGTTAALMQDPRWPAVITAITRASEHGIPYTDLFRHPVGPDGEPVPGHALADALIYRATVLTDPAPYDPANPDHHDRTHYGDHDGTHDSTQDGHGTAEDAPPPFPDDPYDADLQPPEDLHMANDLHTQLHSTGDINRASDNIAEPPLDYSEQWRSRPLPPLDEETIPADLLTLSEAEIDQELYWAAQTRTPVWEPSDQQTEPALTRIAEADLAEVSPERIAELNEQATVFYQAAYRGSWAQTYLTDRLGGTDLTGDLRVRPGFAPKTWSALADHLRRHGATHEELLAAGLSRQASTGRLIDTFRDRLILPIHATSPSHASDGMAMQVVGFVGRRHPDHDTVQPGTDAAAKAGPKYLNTGETVLFAKGDQLYGLAQHTDRLASGATPVIVEGPLDAIAVSLASPDHVGVAPLGTALTDTQVDSLTPHTQVEREPIVATDADPAGQAAADRDYWMLTARGADPRHLAFPAGHDPASLLRQEGPAALAHRLNTSTRSLAAVLVDERLNHLPVAEALPAAAAVIAAGRANHWRPRTAVVADRLHVPPDVALTELVAQTGRWDGDRHAALQAQLQNVRQLRDRIATQNQLPDTQRWAPLARQVDPSLVQAPTWPPLAAAIAEASRAGRDLPTLLNEVLARGPLDPAEPGLDLERRLTADLDPEPTPWRRPRTEQPDNRHGDARHSFATTPPAPSTPHLTPRPSEPSHGEGPGR
jgi:DNA primase catalytic core